MNSPFRLLCALALSICAPVLFAGSYERFPLPRTVITEAVDVAAADPYAWVAPRWHSVVSRVALDGTVIDTFATGFVFGKQIALDPADGGVWCAETTRAAHVSVTGEVTRYDLPWSVNNPVQDILVGPDDRIYVARRSDLVRLARNGDVTQFALRNDYHFDPTALAAGADGNVWLVSHDNNAVGRLTAAGVFTVFPNLDTDSPNGLAQGSDGNLWFTSNLGRLRKVSTSGVITDAAPGVPASGTVVRASDGKLWFGSGNGAIKRYDIGTNSIIGSYSVSQDLGWVWPMSAAASGVWWVSGTSTLHRITDDGVQHEATFTSESASPGAMASSPDYVWFVAPEANQIGRTNPVDHTTALFDLPHPDSRPIDIVAGPGGMWFTEETGDRIGRIDANGVITEFNVTTPSSKPTGIALGPDGNIWFTLAAADRIGRVTPAGVVSEFPLPGPGRYPNSIVAGPDGSLWFTSHDLGQVGRISVTGAVVEFDAGGVSPAEIVSAPDGNLWYETNGAIHRMTPSGDATSFELSGSIAQFIVGSDGALWGLSSNGPTLARIALEGTAVYQELLSIVGRGIANGPDGKIWINDSDTQSLYRRIPDEPIMAIGQTLCHDQNAYGGVVASFIDPVPTGTVADYTATVDWGDHVIDSLSTTITQTSPGHFDVNAYHDNSFAPVAAKVTFTAKPRPGSIGQTVTAVAAVAQVTGTVNRTTFYGEGGGGTITVNAEAGCGWAVYHQTPWIIFPNGDSGTGSRVIAFKVLRNDTGSDRLGFINIGGTPFTIQQSAAPMPPTSLYLITPCRLFDSRNNNTQIPTGATWEMQAANHCGIPADAAAIVANVTAVTPSASGWMSLYPAATPWPGVSTLSYRKGKTRANNAIVPLQADKLSIYNGGPSLHFLIDVTGYFK